ETGPLDPALVHAQQHIGPVAGFGSTRARVDGKKCVGTIVFSGKELAQLEFFQSPDDSRMLGYHLLLSLAPRAQIVLFICKLLQSLEIVDLTLQFAHRIEQTLESRDFFDVSLGLLAVGPEITRSHAGFKSP